VEFEITIQPFICGDYFPYAAMEPVLSLSSVLLTWDCCLVQYQVTSEFYTAVLYGLNISNANDQPNAMNLYESDVGAKCRQKQGHLET